MIALGRLRRERPRDATAFASCGAEVTHEAERLECLEVSRREVHVVCSRCGVQADTRDEDPLGLDHAVGGLGRQGRRALVVAPALGERPQLVEPLENGAHETARPPSRCALRRDGPAGPSRPRTRRASGDRGAARSTARRLPRHRRRRGDRAAIGRLRQARRKAPRPHLRAERFRRGDRSTSTPGARWRAISSARGPARRRGS